MNLTMPHDSLYKVEIYVLYTALSGCKTFGLLEGLISIAAYFL